MICDFPALVFILNMLYPVRKLAFISLVFQEFYMGIILIHDKVIPTVGLDTILVFLSNILGLC